MKNDTYMQWTPQQHQKLLCGFAKILNHLLGV